MNLTSLTISAALKGIHERQFSSVEIVNACLQRINTLDSTLNSFITIDGESALLAAREADNTPIELRGGKPLLGIPIAVKDLYDQAGIPTTAGAPRVGTHPVRDSVAIERIVSNGGIILGKCNLNEWAIGATGENTFFGSVRNPWDIKRISGGSSSGSAVAVAAGFCPGALGTDTGGSIRVPAALCGVIGMKPSYGRISLSGVHPLSWSLDHAGLLARTVRDISILLEVLAGPDPLDERTWAYPMESYINGLDSGIAGWRIALLDTDNYPVCTNEIRLAMKQVENTLGKSGAACKLERADWILEARSRNRTIIAVESGVILSEHLEQNPGHFSPPVLERLQRGSSVSSSEYARALLYRGDLRRECRTFFKNFDILITPTVPFVAPKLEDAEEMTHGREHLSTFLGAFNLAGLPTLSIPWMLNSHGLPVGLQIVGGEGQDGKVLIAAQAIERSRDALGIAPI